MIAFFCCGTLALMPDPGISVHFRMADDGKAALHVAAEHGSTAAARQLLASGAAVDLQDLLGGWTAMHYAAAHQQTEVVELVRTFQLLPLASRFSHLLLASPSCFSLLASCCSLLPSPFSLLPSPFSCLSSLSSLSSPMPYFLCCLPLPPLPRVGGSDQPTHRSLPGACSCWNTVRTSGFRTGRVGCHTRWYAHTSNRRTPHARA